MITTGTTVMLPLQNVSDKEESSNLNSIDVAFTKLLSKLPPHVPPLPKIAQKRVVVCNDSFEICYSWRYDPNSFISLGDLIEFKNNFRNITDIRFNPTGGCCSKDTNSFYGITSPCYCDQCSFERDGRSDENIPRCPVGSSGRFIISVKRSSIKRVSDVIDG